MQAEDTPSSSAASDRTAAAAPVMGSEAEKANGAHGPSSKETTAEDRNSSPTEREESRQRKAKLTHEEKEAAQVGWRSEVQEIPKQVSLFSHCPIRIFRQSGRNASGRTSRP